MREQKNILLNITSSLSESVQIRQVAFLGNCRVWTTKVLHYIDQNSWYEIYGVEAIAVEANVEPHLSHTFLYLKVNGEEFLWDGVGLTYKPGYFGPISEAPDHLQHFRPDMINRYRIQKHDY